MERMIMRVGEKPAYPRADEMMSRLREARERAKRGNEMIQPNRYITKAAENRLARKNSARRWLNRKLRILYRDLNFFIDFCIARLIVWRATRHRN